MVVARNGDSSTYIASAAASFYAASSVLSSDVSVILANARAFHAGIESTERICGLLMHVARTHA